MSDLLDIPKEQLYELYINQGIEVEILSALYGKSKSALRKIIREYGLCTLQEKKQRYLSLYVYWQKRATERGHSFELTEAQFCSIVTKECHYCGRSPYKRYDFKSIDWMGIDRADNTKGYTFENSRPCCGTCNIAKGGLSEQQFIW